MSRPNVLFICNHNSARSQMAEGLLRTFHGDVANAYSAGLVASQVKPLAVEVMEEIGVDMSGCTSKALDALAGIPLGYVVTVCDAAQEACPYVRARIQVLHKNFPRPSATGTSEEEKRDAFRRVRNEIRTWLADEFVPALQHPASTIS